MPPRIPYYGVSEIPAGGQLNTRQATPADFGGDMGLSSFGQDIQQSAAIVNLVDKESQARLEAKRRQDETIEIERLTSLARAQTMENQQAAEKAAPIGAAGHVEQFNEAFTKYREKLVENAKLSDQGRAHLNANLEGIRVPLLREAIQFESAESGKAAATAVKQIFAANRNAVAANPSLLDAIREQESRLIDGLTSIPEQVRSVMREDSKWRINDAALDGSIDALQRGEVSQAEIARYRDEVLSTKYWQENASPQGYERALNRLDALSKQTGAVQSHRLDGLIADARAAAKEGKTTAIPAEAFEAYKDPLIRKDKQDIYNQSQQLAADITALSGKSFSEIGQFLAGKEPKETGEGYTERKQDFASLIVAANEISKQYHDDPAGYAARTDPKVKQAFDAYLAQQDPRARALAARDYGDQVSAFQERMGAPTGKILPKAMADSIVQRFASDPGGQRTVQMTRALAEEWGAYSPQVYGQVAKDLPDTPLVIGAGMKEGPAMLLSGLTQEKIGEIKKGLPKTTETDIRDQLDKQFEQGRISLIASEPVSGMRTFNSFYGAAEKLAMLYVSMGNGKSAKDAAKQAYADTFGDKYEFIRSGDSYLRVPKPHDIGAVAQGLSIVKNNAAELGIEPLRSLSGLDATQRLAATIDLVKAGGYWVTSRDEAGATLYFQGAPVLKAGNEPPEQRMIFQSWYALETAYRTVKSPTGVQQPRFIETPSGAVGGPGRDLPGIRVWGRGR